MDYDEGELEEWYPLDPEHTEYYSHFSKEDQARDIITALFLFIKAKSELINISNPKQEHIDRSLKYKELLVSKDLPGCSCAAVFPEPSYKDIFMRKRWTYEQVMDHFIKYGEYHGGDLGKWENIQISQTIPEIQRPGVKL